jgi:flagellar motor protein MotB
LKSKSKTTEEQGPKVPGYIVTFSDMVTLLLTFFVMLLTLADVQDPELFDKGRDSFIESLRYVGLGSLIGRQQKPNLGSLKTIHSIPNPEQTSNRRTIDAKAEELYRIFETLKQSVTTMSSQLTAERVNFSVTNIRFSPDSIELDKSAVTFLTEFCRDLHLSTNGKPGILYVLGLAPDAKTEKEQWILSARRAESVAQFMRKNLDSAASIQQQQDFSESLLKWTVYSWGTGPGGQWAGPDSFISEHSQILIAILR